MGLPSLSDDDKASGKPIFIMRGELDALQPLRSSTTGRGDQEVNASCTPRATATSLNTAMHLTSQAAAAGKVVAGLLTGAYEATRFKAKPKLSKLESLAVLTPGAGNAAQSAIDTAAGLAAGTTLTRCASAFAE